MSPAARRVTIAVVALHGLLLLVSLPDCFVSAGSGYHVSLARWYGEHGTAWRDHISYGPSGRPNLQGPLMHMAIGYQGRVLGGDGMDYLHANAVLALAQWAAAVFSVWLFAQRIGGDWAALFSTALFSGALFASISFAVGIPSGWIFILSAWAAWIVQDYKRFLLQAPLVLAVIAGTELARLRERIAPGFRRPLVAGLVALATIIPLAQPALAFELMWTFGPRSPRFVDGNERKQLAEVIGRAGLKDRLVRGWNTTECIAMAVFVPLRFEGGHWVEVQPRVDPAQQLSAGVKVYALSVPMDDPVLGQFAGAGLLSIHGGTPVNSIATLNGPASPEAGHRQLRANLAQWAREIGSLERQTLPTPEMDRINQELFRDYFR